MEVMDVYYARRILLAIFFLFLSIFLTFIFMIITFPIINSISNYEQTEKIFSCFVVSSMAANAIIFVHFSFRYGVPFRGGDWWNWLVGDEDMGNSVKNGIIGAVILSLIFLAYYFSTLGIKILVENFLSVITSATREKYDITILSSFWINVIPAYVVTNLLFVYNFMKKKMISIGDKSWKLSVDFNRFSSVLSLTFFMVFSILFCYWILFGTLHLI